MALTAEERKARAQYFREQQKPLELTFAQWKRLASELIETGEIAALDGWPDYSTHVCGVYFGGNRLAYNVLGSHAVARQLAQTSYRTVFRSWFERICPSGYMPIARGLHGLCITAEEDLWATVWPNRSTEFAETAYSMNLPVASQEFTESVTARFALQLARSGAEKKAKRARRQRRQAWASRGASWSRAWESWRTCAHEYMEQHGLAGTRGFARALQATETPVVICAKVRLEDLKGWGGDSESGPLQEAEVHSRAFPLERIERIFVGTSSRLGRSTTLRERKRYALDRWKVARIDPVFAETHFPYIEMVQYWDAFELPLHGEAKVCGGFQIAEKRRATHWRCVYARDDA